MTCGLGNRRSILLSYGRSLSFMRIICDNLFPFSMTATFCPRIMFLYGRPQTLNRNVAAMAASSLKRKKSNKPPPSFPLAAHNNGQWCKRARGKVHHFGAWKNSDVALQCYLQVAENLHAGRQPQALTLSSDDPTVKKVCN